MNPEVLWKNNVPEDLLIFQHFEQIRLQEKEFWQSARLHQPRKLYASYEQGKESEFRVHALYLHHNFSTYITRIPLIISTDKYLLEGELDLRTPEMEPRKFAAVSHTFEALVQAYLRQIWVITSLF